MRVEKSFCRLCFGFCGMDVTIGDDGRVVSVKPDRENPATLGYSCVKGLDVAEALYGEQRIMRPLKRVGDSHIEIPLEQALDGFVGTVLAVSHDRTFLARLDRFVMINDDGSVYSLPDYTTAMAALSDPANVASVKLAKVLTGV